MHGPDPSLLKRKFVSNLLLVLTLNLLVKPFWVFGIDRTVQNLVGAEIYGFYFSLFSFSILLNILLDAGITNFNNRSIARDPTRLNEYLINIIVLKIILAVFYVLTCTITGVIIGYDSSQFRLLLVLLANQFLASLVLYMRSNISGLHYFRTDSLLSVLDRSLAIIFCSLLLWGGFTKTKFRIEWFVYCQTLAYAVTAVISFFIVRSRVRKLSFRVDRAKMLHILRQSYPFAVLILLMAFYYRIDTVMIERMLPDGKQQAGIYAQSFRILDAAGMFAFLYAGLLLPIFSRMLKNNEQVTEMVHLSCRLIYIPAIILAFMSLFWSREIICLLYNEHIASSSGIFPILMFGFVSIATTYIFGTLLTASGNLRELNLLALSAVILNILLNMILIRTYKAWGAALSSLITQSYMALSQVLIACYKLKFRLNYLFLIHLLVYCSGTYLIARLTREIFDNWLIALSVYTVSGIIFAFAIRLLNIRAILILLQVRNHER